MSENAAQSDNSSGAENNENEWEKLYDDEGKCLSSELEKVTKIKKKFSISTCLIF